MKSFDALDLIEPLRRAIAEKNYTTPTPIQAQAIPPLLEGRDVLGCAQTGTGKTAAFLLPILQKLASHKPKGRRKIRALILSPTRELALQIGECCRDYSTHLPLKYLTIFGGVSQRPQVDDLYRGVDVLVATPGRLLDLMNQKHISLANVEHFVLDEADRMLDMGFIRDIRKVLAKLPSQRQNLLFSATMPKSIVELASGFLHDPVRVEVHPQSSAVDTIDQKVMFVDRPNKKHLLVSLLKDPSLYSVVLFSRTKHGADRLARILNKNDISAAAIHGNKSQGARQRALAGFKAGDVRVLVATDIASRGIDVDGVTHVINHCLPNESESYVHRIGRTGRAGQTGVAISFCDETESGYLRDIERLIGKTIERVTDHEWHHEAAIPQGAPPPSPNKRSRRGRRSGGRQGGRAQQTRHNQGAPKNAGSGPDRSDDQSNQRRQRTDRSEGQSNQRGPRSDRGQSGSRRGRRDGGQSRDENRSNDGRRAASSANTGNGQSADGESRRRSGRRRRPKPRGHAPRSNSTTGAND